MKSIADSGLKGLILAGLLAALPGLALAGASPDPTRVHFLGPIPWSVETVQCAGLGPDPVLVETFIEELWGHQLGGFNTGFTDGSGGVHLVQPARWIMSGISLGGDYSWLGRVSGRAVSNSPSQTAGGNFSYLVNTILRADGDWPDLKLRLTVRFVVDANGNLKVFDDVVEIYCMD